MRESVSWVISFLLIQKQKVTFKALIFLALVCLPGIFFGVYAWAIICTVEAPPVLSITDNTGPFTLVFNNFREGTNSTPEVVTYTIQANQMAAGTLTGAISANLSDLFTEINLKADVDSYTNAGDPGFASLSESSGGDIVVGNVSTNLANKTPGTGQGDACLDGTLSITWKATLTKDHPGGSETRIVTVTLKDGQP